MQPEAVPVTMDSILFYGEDSVFFKDSNLRLPWLVLKTVRALRGAVRAKATTFSIGQGLAQLRVEVEHRERTVCVSRRDAT